MRCENVKQLLPLYLTDELDQQQSETVKDHLASCPDCRSEFEELQEMASLLKTQLKPEPAPDLQLDTEKSKRRLYYISYVAAAALIFFIIILAVQSDEPDLTWENNQLSVLTEMNESLDILETTASTDPYPISNKDDLFYSISEHTDYLQSVKE
jgi:predicted anti-sigma-YlaC factor YlaD